jgi:inner membrane protein
MATLVTHFIVGASVALPICRAQTLGGVIRPSAFVLSAGLLSLLPDLDTVYMRWVPYENFFGHRGIWHSPFVLVMLAAILATFVGLLVRQIPARAVLLLGATWAAAGVSHPLLDALTDGGLGVMMFFPFSEERFFFPWRPLHVARIGVTGALASFSRVFPSEIPLCAGALILGCSAYLAQSWKSRSGSMKSSS